MLALIDYGAGNLHSVANALAAAAATGVEVTSDPARVLAADRVVLPGVGAFAHAMASLLAIPGLVDALHRRVVEQATPFLGVCVGMQLMADTGLEHGETPGLGWIGGSVAPLAPHPGLKVPHMGWNDVTPSSARTHPLVPEGEAYFLHGYAFAPSDLADVIAVTDHGAPVVAAVGRANMIGVQFHPEKSQRYGIALLERFLTWRP